MIARSQLRKKQPPPAPTPVEFLVRVTNVAIKSRSDPGDQLRVAARRPESTIVKADGGYGHSSQRERGGVCRGEGGRSANERH